MQRDRRRQGSLPHGKKHQPERKGVEPGQESSIHGDGEGESSSFSNRWDEEGRERYLSLKNASATKTRNRRARGELSQNSERRRAFGWVGLYMKTECRQGKAKAVDSTGVLVPRCWWHRFLRFFLILFVSGLGFLGRCFWGVEKKRKEKSAGKASSQTSGG